MFIARQPIFNRSMRIYGYELLFRPDINAKEFGNASAMSATATVISGLFEEGIEKIAAGTKAFVNFDYEFLMSDTIELIDPDNLVIEVLESVVPDDALQKRLSYLQEKGYNIALDDFICDSKRCSIAPAADIIKFDIMLTPLDTIKKDVRHALANNKVILAEKIETEEEFKKAYEMGFHMFQGFFFSRPKIIGRSSARKTSKLQYARILNELQKEEASYNAIARIVEADVDLAYRVMQIISHKNTDKKDSFNSIKNALVRMGLEELGRWVRVLMIQDISKNKPLELMNLSLIRLKFGELIAMNSIYKKRRDEIATMCLFSTLDAILDQPMEEALEGIAISEDIFNSLVLGTGDLQPVSQIIMAYEKGEWESVDAIAEKINIDVSKLYPGYLQAIQWAERIIENFRK